MSRLEFWILNSCVMHAESIRALGWEDDFEFLVWFGREKPTQDRAEMADILRNLFLKGDLTANWDCDKRGWAKPSFCPDRHEIDLVISRAPGQRDLWYSLTRQGGARWESAANADWSKFVEVRDSSFDWPRIRTYYRATSASHFAIGQDLREERFHGKAFQYETARWCIIRDWQATYWKTLPLVCRLSGILMRVAPEPQFPLLWSSSRFEWYTDPWAESSAYPQIAVPGPDQPIPKVPPPCWGIVGPEWQWNENLFEE